MSHRLLEGFIKADSNNIPVVDIHMFSDYIKKDANFICPEIRCVKATRNGRESYGDSVIGYVQIKRTEKYCTIVAACCPEQSVRSKSYRVQVEVDLENSEIKSAICHDCVASAGGCKHSLAVLGWLHRESEKKSVTEVKAYWKKSKLSRVGSTIKFVEAKALYSKSKKSKDPVIRLRKSSPANSFYQEVVILLHHNHQDLNRHSTTISGNQSTNVNDFFVFLKSHMTKETCRVAELKTQDQSENKDWFRLKYCRITASKVYEASKCRTSDGSLTNTLFGASKLRDSKSMSRGRKLEPLVLKQVEIKTKMKFERCGIFLSSDHPVFGASPDGICSTHVLEIKCPLTAKTKLNYIESNGKIAEKVKSQIQLQMAFTGREMGFLCVADPDFENTENVEIILVPYDKEYVESLLQKSLQFWIDSIWPVLISI
ncbi:Uncharacterized protein APZ42_030209 [Daphnia magna]|uniref:YqaJ viral recombinase domain-containing protein n=1 Tax=Daphnia magna TaxID=35525 RepID=A0A164NZ12_9CRUS|nr:Uncharacterized protein APZ42_030209 [Daphnia magna]